MASSKRKARTKTATEKMEKRLSEQLDGKEVVIVESADGVKMSEVLEAFIAPYMEFAETEESFEKLVTIAVIAWNTSLLPRLAQTKSINDLLTSLPPETRTDAKSIVRDLIRRKRKHFGKIRRAIIDFEIADTRDGFHLMVASTPENI
ncbi:hypothetical protein EH222_14145 [candidate division KSB1 bacterium]|nr:MAG: hypothetical protein EH222_14145 [candidate division KSB1 bacterium]